MPFVNCKANWNLETVVNTSFLKNSLSFPQTRCRSQFVQEAILEKALALSRFSVFRWIFFP